VIGMAAQGHEDNRPAKRPNSRKHGAQVAHFVCELRDLIESPETALLDL
jgi:hypothetical protein